MPPVKFQLLSLLPLILVVATGNTLWSQSNANNKAGGLNSANVPYQTGLTQIPQFAHAKMVRAIDGMTTVHYTERSTYVVGSPYLYESYLPGEITLKEGTLLKNLPVRYNIADDIMEFIYITDTLDIIDPLRLSRIRFAEKDFIYCIGMTESNTVSGNYFEVLYEDGKIKLLLKYLVKLERDEYLNNYAGGFGSGDLYYKSDEQYYILDYEGAARQIRTKRDIFKLFPEYKKDISAFWKQENLRFKNRQDLLKITNFIAEKTQ